MRKITPQKCVLLLVLALPLVILLAISLGAVHFSIADILGLSEETPAHISIIIWDIRLPRALLAVCVGGILAISGAIMQGLFRNPLADPSLIGVTAGASLGASIVIVFFAATSSQILGLPLISLGAFLGGALAVLWVYRLSYSPYGVSVATMLLAGIAITALAGSLSSFLVFYADNELLRRISIWQMGGLDGATMTMVSVAFVSLLILCVIFFRFSQAFNAFLLGESEARHLGIATEKIKIVSIVLVAAGVGIAVALAGTIAFVGLVVPHMIRLLIGPDHKYLFISSALAGGLLLCIADIAARVLLAPVELPVGLLTALIGVPFFVALLRQRPFLR